MAVRIVVGIHTFGFEIEDSNRPTRSGELLKWNYFSGPAFRVFLEGLSLKIAYHCDQ